VVIVLEEQNDAALKHAFNGELLQHFATAILVYFPSFRSEEFLKIEAELHQMEMKARVRRIRDCLAQELPQDYPRALEILMQVLHQDTFRGFSIWPIAEFIQSYGLNDLKISLEALQLLTTRFTSEWAVRPLIKHYPEETMDFLLQCTQHENVDIRRWASEGTRPRLPWGEHLQKFIQNPEATKDILEALKFDTELFVRKSVANHLNDISKDHPDYVIQLLNRWQKQAQGEDQKKIEWIIKHALRTLIKNGHPKALALIGVHYDAMINIEKFKIIENQLRLGDDLEFEIQIQSLSNQTQRVVMDYILHFMKSNQKTAPKVFKLRTFELAAHERVVIKKKHTVRKVTTRQYYTGQQKIEIQVNGKVFGGLEWYLELTD